MSTPRLRTTPWSEVRSRLRVVERSTESFPAGIEAEGYTIGDIVLTHTDGVGGLVVRWGQRLRFHGPRRRFAQWNHCALIVSDKGDLVEALPRTGATRSHLNKYLPRERTIIRTRTHDLDQGEILQFADRIVGEPYGWLCDFFVFLGYLTGNLLNVSVQHQVMCSELVARAQERSGTYFPRLPQSMAPGDIAEFYGVPD